MNLKNMSIKEIKNKIYQKGINNSEIEDYISENYDKLREYEEKSAKKLVEKKNSEEPLKVKAYLLNKGFDIDIVNKIMSGE